MPPLVPYVPHENLIAKLQLSFRSRGNTFAPRATSAEVSLDTGRNLRISVNFVFDFNDKRPASG
jgi:hypothetical protein